MSRLWWSLVHAAGSLLKLWGKLLRDLAQVRLEELLYPDEGEGEE